MLARERADKLTSRILKKIHIHIADFTVELELDEELMALPDSMLTLKLRSVPEGVSQVRIQPQRVQFLIEQTEE